MTTLAPLVLGEQLKCYFSYNQEVGSPGGIWYPSVGGGAFGLVHYSGFVIFDTREQKIKVVGFLNTKPGLFTIGEFEYFGVDVFAGERTLDVMKRDDSGPVTTLAELFDFENTVWYGHETIVMADGTTLYRSLSVSEDGSWEKLQFDSRSESPWTTNGRITGFSVFTGTNPSFLRPAQFRANCD